MSEIESVIKEHHDNTVIQTLKEAHDKVLSRALEHEFDPKYCTGLYDAIEVIERLIKEKEVV